MPRSNGHMRDADDCARMPRRDRVKQSMSATATVGLVWKVASIAVLIGGIVFTAGNWYARSEATENKASENSDAISEIRKDVSAIKTDVAKILGKLEDDE